MQNQILIVQKKKGKFMNCDYCNQKVYKYPYQIKKLKRFFCNNRCRFSYNKNKTLEELFGYDKCVKIKEKNRLKHLGKKSSKETIEKLKRRKKYWLGRIRFDMLGENNPAKREIVRKKISEKNMGRVIGVEWKKNISLGQIGIRAKEKHHLWGKHHSLETREKMNEKRKLQVCPIKDTQIELKIQNFLKELKIEYNSHKYINIKHGYLCDIYIPSLNLIIECDGNYWHHYPNGTEIDSIRTKELIENGFNVLRLWESEIKDMNLLDFQTKINEFSCVDIFVKDGEEEDEKIKSRKGR